MNDCDYSRGTSRMSDASDKSRFMRFFDIIEAEIELVSKQMEA